MMLCRMSPRGIEVPRTLAEQARRAAFARHMGNAAAAAVYLGPPTKGLPASVRLTRAFVLRRRVRLAFQSADTKRKRHDLMKGVLAIAALGALALAFGPRRQPPAETP